MVGLWLDSRPWFRIFPTLPRIAKVSVHGLSGRESGRKLIGRERDGREVDSTASLRWKKTGTYILSVYKRGEKTRARAEAEARARESGLKGDLWILLTEKSVSLPRCYVDFALYFAKTSKRLLRGDSFCIRSCCFRGARRIIARNDRKFRRVALTGPLVSMRVHANTW